MTAKKAGRLLLGLLLGGFFLWLTLQRIDGDRVVSVMSDARMPEIVLGVVAFFIGYSFRIERWRLMMTAGNPALRWRDCAGPFMASIAANNVLPFRAGDVLRAFAFNRKLAVGAATALTTLVVERLLDLLMVVFFLGLALMYFGIDSSRVVDIGGMVLIGGAACILFVLLLPGAVKPLVMGLSRLVARVLPKLGDKLLVKAGEVFSALGYTAKGRTMLRLVFLSVAAWGAEGIVFWLAALALPSIASPISGWLALPVGTLATVVPSTPGYVGTFDYFVVQAMVVSGNAIESSTGYAFLVHALLWFPPTIVGGVYVLLSPIKAGLKGISRDAC